MKDSPSQGLINLCGKIAEAAASAALGFSVKLSANEFYSRGKELAEQFSVVYKAAGKPYGDSEESLLRYVKENTTYRIDPDG